MSVTRDFNNIETQAVFKFFFLPPPLQGKAPKEIHAILTETLAFFLPDRAKDLSAPHVNLIETAKKNSVEFQHFPIYVVTSQTVCV